MVPSTFHEGKFAEQWWEASRGSGKGGVLRGVHWALLYCHRSQESSLTVMYPVQATPVSFPYRVPDGKGGKESKVSGRKRRNRKDG